MNEYTPRRDDNIIAKGFSPGSESENERALKGRNTGTEQRSAFWPLRSESLNDSPAESLPAIRSPKPITTPVANLNPELWREASKRLPSKLDYLDFDDGYAAAVEAWHDHFTYSTESQGNQPEAWSIGFMKGIQDLKENRYRIFNREPYNETVIEREERFPSEGWLETKVDPLLLAYRLGYYQGQKATEGAYRHVRPCHRPSRELGKQSGSQPTNLRTYEPTNLSLSALAKWAGFCDGNVHDAPKQTVREVQALLLEPYFLFAGTPDPYTAVNS